MYYYNSLPVILLSVAYVHAGVPGPRHAMTTLNTNTPALPARTPPPPPTMHGVHVRKRQNADDLVATVPTGSAISKLHTVPYTNSSSSASPICYVYEDPDSGQDGASCACNGATPAYVPTNFVGNTLCAYTIVPGSYATLAPAPNTALNTPHTVTEGNGVVSVYPSETTSLIAGVTITEGAGTPSAVSTVSSMAAQASVAALYADGFCGWADSDVLIAWGVFLPNWLSDGYDFDTVNSDLTNALHGSSACNSFSHYSASSGGSQNTTLVTEFWTTIFCTAFDMTNIIKSATGGALDLACNKYASQADVHPDAPEPEAGESEPEDPDADV